MLRNGSTLLIYLKFGAVLPASLNVKQADIS